MSHLMPLVGGIVVFLLGHALPRWFGLRETLVARMGQGAYRVLHSLLSLVALGLVVHGYAVYRAGGYIPLWEVPRFFNHIAILLVWPAMVLVAAAFFPGSIKARVKHPLLTGVKLWALVHLLVNGDLGSLLLFGALLGLAVATRIRLKHLGAGEALPAAPASARNDALAIALGTGFTLAMVLGLHRMLIGVSVF